MSHEYTDPTITDPVLLEGIQIQNGSRLTPEQLQILLDWKDSQLEKQEGLSIIQLIKFWTKQKGEGLENKIDDILEQFETKYKPRLGDKQIEDIQMYSNSLDEEVLKKMPLKDQQRLHELFVKGVTRPANPLEAGKSLIRKAAFLTAYKAAKAILYPGKIVATTLQSDSIIAPALYCTASVGSYVVGKLITSILFGGIAAMGSQMLDSCNSTSSTSGGKRLRTRTRKNKRKNIKKSARTLRHR